MYEKREMMKTLIKRMRLEMLRDLMKEREEFNLDKAFLRGEDQISSKVHSLPKTMPK